MPAITLPDKSVLRFDGPVQVIDRYAARDTSVGERVYKRNDKVTAVVGSAGHDGGRFRRLLSFSDRR